MTCIQKFCGSNVHGNEATENKMPVYFFSQYVQTKFRETVDSFKVICLPNK